MHIQHAGSLQVDFRIRLALGYVDSSRITSKRSLIPVADITKSTFVLGAAVASAVRKPFAFSEREKLLYSAVWFNFRSMQVPVELFLFFRQLPDLGILKFLPKTRSSRSRLLPPNILV
jgi:hypothetical protein